MIRMRIERDPDPMSPNEYGDDGVFLVAFHRQFSVVHEGLKCPDDIEGWDEDYDIFPLFAYIHSGVALSIGEFSCPWDSGQVGYVLVKKGEVPDARKAAESLVETWNQHLCGDIWGFIVEKIEECSECGTDHVEHLDSCWGFYGEDDAREAGEEALKCCQ